ncbi:hypothetical protein [Alkalicoccus luteus]|uniref:Uncharacterized protein n=1 Tax=Alkalicoccus luteus TaxID=1237094 RepID=A0A969PME3_9BACI|nr:hypothetical protein [Alkalicoccus luteus]NJP36090.1 hypothetical protein [Alkalicoccus luteus]
MQRLRTAAVITAAAFLGGCGSDEPMEVWEPDESETETVLTIMSDTWIGVSFESEPRRMVMAEMEHYTYGELEEETSGGVGVELEGEEGFAFGSVRDEEDALLFDVGIHSGGTTGSARPRVEKDALHEDSFGLISMREENFHEASLEDGSHAVESNLLTGVADNPDMLDDYPAAFLLKLSYE